MEYKSYLYPEEAGVPSSALLAFHESLKKSGLCLHATMILRHGKIVHEAYWKPIDENFRHRIYSCSKSVTSIAVGKLVTEGRVRITDKISDYFKDLLPENPNRYVLSATIRDCLMMSSMNNENSYKGGGGEGRQYRDWIWSFFNSNANHMPGAFFLYDTAATTVLCALVERLTGKTFLEYLRPEFDIMGISPKIDCVKTPDGIAWGGSGVRVTMRDYGRLALLALNRGAWEGKQLIDHQYMLEATTRQIDNGSYGYGYQFWMDRDNGFWFNGMGSQFAFCYPERDLIICFHADTQGSPAQPIIDAKNALFDSILDSALPADEKAFAELKEFTSDLNIVCQTGELSSTRENEFFQKKYVMDKNPMGIKWMEFTVESGVGVWKYENEQGVCRVEFGFGKNVLGKFPQENYYYDQIGVPSGYRYDCAHSAAWVEPHKLVIRGWLIDRYLGNYRAEFSFIDDTVSVIMTKTAEWFLEEYQGIACGSYLR
ncbi:MAG: serine hydrolase [Clostridiales bacterium]|nr:serine hydrolase [Clostridiales bacterium]